MILSLTPSVNPSDEYPLTFEPMQMKLAMVANKMDIIFMASRGIDAGEVPVVRKSRDRGELNRHLCSCCSSIPTSNSNSKKY